MADLRENTSSFGCPGRLFGSCAGYEDFSSQDKEGEVLSPGAGISGGACSTADLVAFLKEEGYENRAEGILCPFTFHFVHSDRYLRKSSGRGAAAEYSLRVKGRRKWVLSA